jgi:TRAP-type C4-dicarboxylate transport system permease small subunit
VTRFFRLLAEAERALLSTIMLTMVVLYCSAIAVRSFVPAYASSVAWVDEATRFFLVWMVFLGLGLALAQGKHVAMSVFLQHMPPQLLRGLRAAIDVTGLVFSLYVVWVGIEITGLVLATGQRSPTLGISAAILYATLPVGFSLLALRYLASLIGLIDRWSAAEMASASRED